MGFATGTQLGPYEVIAPLGAGGMGEVWEAWDPRLDRRVALKVLRSDVAADADRLARFEREAKAIAALNHPNILSVHDVGFEGGTPYVVTELLEGENLREVVSARSPTQRQVLGWAVQVAHGLAAAHRKGVVHRDLKPENLFLTADGRIKILDFGLAKLAPAKTDAATSSLATESALTGAGVVMGTVAYMSPEQAQGRPVDSRSDLFSFGVVLYELLAGRHPFRRETGPATLGAILQDSPPPLSAVDPSIPRAVERIVERCLEKRWEERFEGAHDLALALEAVLERPGETPALFDVEEKSPYPGLSSFTEEDADRFFGREEEVETLWMKLRSRRMMGVIGPSGAGKTSFVRAGLVARRPDGWSAVVCTPGRVPLRSLGQALGPELSRDPEALRKIAGFEDPDTAFELLVRWRRAHGEALVVVDQFEELFTLGDAEAQARFASLLGRLASEADVHVLLSMRDDFLMRCHDHAALAPVFEALTPLGPMTRDGLRRAVVEPARRQGYQFEEDALVDEVIASVEGVRGALPPLAFAMSRLWERRDRERRLLTRESYEEIGGVAGALAQHAEATMDRVGPERQGLVRDIFRNLVTAQGTRAVLDRGELLSAFRDRSAAEAVLRQLVDSRLVTSWEPEGREGESGRQLVEIVHESLLKAWPRLVRWQTQDADGAQLRDQLRQAAHLWKERGGTEDLLWTGTAYLDYRAWRQNYRGGLSSVEEEFAKAMAAKARRKRLLVRAAAAAIVLVSVGVAIAIGASRQRAVAAARNAEASKLLAIAQLKLQEDPTEALAFTTASLEVSDSKEARLLALRALQEAPPAWEVPSGTSMARLPVFSPDGRRLAVAGLSPEVCLWDENGASPACLPGHEVTPRGGNKAMWASDELLVTGLVSLGRQVHVWKASAAPPAKVRTIDFEARSTWQVGGGQLSAESETSSPGVLALRSWKLPDGDAKPLGIVGAARFGATSSAFKPHERWVAGDPAESARLKARSTAALPGARPLDLRREGSWYAALGAFHPAGRLAVATTHNLSRLTFWPLPARSKSVVDGYKVVHRPLAFSPDGRWLATSWTDNRLHLWPVPGAASAEPKVLDTPPVEVWTALAFDPHGRYLFAVGRSDNAWIVPIDGSPGRKLHAYSKETLLYACSTSPTGSRVATAYYYGEGRKTLRVWDVETGKVLLLELPQGSAAAEGASRERTGIEGGVTSLAFVNDSTLLTAGEGGIRRWNLETGEHELIRAVADDRWIRTLSTDGREVLYCETSREERKRVISFGIIDLSTKVARPFEASAPSSPISATTDLHALFAAQGPVVALLGADSSVRVGNRSIGGFHWLFGHAGVPDRVAISPDLRWVATTGEDNTLRLWPMPDLSKPPLHTLPHDELVARLHSLTNLHAVRDPQSENGWKIELGPFPGWKNLPEWPP